jgi:amidase
MPELIYESARKQAVAIRDKEVSSVELVEAHLRRIEEVNPKLNAVVVSLAKRAREQARAADAALAAGAAVGPLHGVPTTIKEAWETEGLECTGGTIGRVGVVAERNATVVARLRNAGAIPLGMTNTPELSLAMESDNLVYGRTNNPYELSRTPGGSGGGGAAIIAAGGSPWEIGGDLGGSIRVPAHFSGIAGIKPTVGRVPLTGYFPPALGVIPMFASIGPMARWVEDLSLTLPIVSGPDGVDPSMVPAPLGDPGAVDVAKLRVVYHTDNGIVAATRETAETVRNAAKALAAAGAAVEEARPAGIEQTAEIFIGFFSADGGAGIRHLLEMCRSARIHPLMEKLLGMLGTGVSGVEFGQLLTRLSLFRNEMFSFFRDYDVILCPTCAIPAIPHGTCWDPETAPVFSYGWSYNLTGWPSAVVRCGASAEGLPIGAQIVARPWREDVALAVALHLEAVLGGWKPPAAV